MEAMLETVKYFTVTKDTSGCGEDFEVRIVTFCDRLGSVRVGCDADVQDAFALTRAERTAVGRAEIDLLAAPLIRRRVGSHRDLENPALVGVDRTRLREPAELESSPLREERGF